MADDLLSIFRVEAAEYLSTLNTTLLKIETLSEGDAAYGKALIEMNRIAHSMKGAARAVGFSPIETLSHYMEDVFDAAMHERLDLTPDICDALYDSLDLIQAVMAGDDDEDSDDGGVDEDALATVLAQFEQIIAASALDATTDSQQVTVVSAVDYDDYDEGVPDDTRESMGVPEFQTHELDRLNGDDDLDDLDETLKLSDVGKRPQRSAEYSKRSTQAVPVVQVTSTYPSVAGIESQTLNLRPLEESVRVTVSKLDRLMAEATELIVAKMHGDERLRVVHELRRAHARWQREWRTVRGEYIRLARRMQDQHYQALGGREESSSELNTLFKFLENNQRYLIDMNRRLAQLAQIMMQDNLHLSTLAEQLQEDISGMRLIPFDTLVPGYQRLVRDLSRDMGKLVQLDVQGAFVEIDKTVLDALKDPIMHLLRNAVDHGIGTPEEREAKGHSPMGRILISVEQRGSEIVIAVGDDGRGISTNKVRRALIKNRLLTEAEASVLNDDEVRFYIFHPGFSTNDAVTQISGRGIGMDIVRDRVESLRGRVSLQSEKGVGTAITINVPVSLTRIRCITFQVGETPFALPSVVVMRMETIPHGRIFTAEGQEMIVVNDQPTPLVSLGAILGVSTFGRTDEGGGFAHIMLIQAANRVVALEVDRLLSEQELVLKPLGAEIAGAQFVSGAALMGDSSVIIVLDANDLVRAASGVGAISRRRLVATLTMPKVAPRRTRVLVVDDSITTRTLEKNILETAGFEVHVAVDGVEAWMMLTEGVYDVVVSDVEMPNMTGLELTRRIKTNPETRDTPVILLTSLGKQEQREAGLRVGANAYLVKSAFDQSELLETIRNVL